MRTGNEADAFISVCESEALQLHALMMSGHNPFILMEPNTIAIIKKIWQYRNETKIPVCFTLDAGPNVHLLFPKIHQQDIQSWISAELIKFCADGVYISDEVGAGPSRI
jgi:diphosphomevalonate decarboxylase